MAGKRRPPSQGERVANFWAEYCCHIKGFKGPLLAEPWQRHFLDLAFELDPRTGRRVFTEVLLGIPRGNSKSTMCAGIGLYLLVADDEPGPEIISAAGKKAQAFEVFGVAGKMAEKNDELDDLLIVQAEEILSRDGEGSWKVITSSGELEQGSNPSGGIVDELHVHKDGSTWNAVYSGAIAKRQQPWLGAISTAGKNRASFLGNMVDRYLAMPDVERPQPYLTIAQDRDAGALMVWYGIPDDELDKVDLDDPAVFDGCNPASWVQGKGAKIRASPGMDDEMMLRFHYNAWKKRAGQGGIPAELWNKCAAPELFTQLAGGATEVGRGCSSGLVLPGGLPVFVGIDLASRDDWLAIVAVGLLEQRIVAEAHLFAPTEDEDIDVVGSILGTLGAMRARGLRIREVGMDLTRDPTAGQETAKEGWPVWEAPQRNNFMAPASLGLWRIMRTGQFAHPGCETYTTHALNARKLDLPMGDDWKFSKPLKEGSRTELDNDKKIDGLIATVIATHRLLTTETSRYETEGFFAA